LIYGLKSSKSSTIALKYTQKKKKKKNKKKKKKKKKLKKKLKKKKKKKKKKYIEEKHANLINFFIKRLALKQWNFNQ